MKELSPKQSRFVTEYIKLGVATQAARAAGYSATTASRAAQKLLGNPKVRAAVDEGRERLRKDSEYTLDKALADLDTLIDEARKAKQYTAVNSLITNKLKITGILDERPTLGVIDLNAVIAAARGRALPGPEQRPMIDVTPRRVENCRLDPAGIFEN